MLTAKEAYRKAHAARYPRSVDEDLATLNKLIKDAADGGEFSLKVPEEMVGRQDNEIWLKAKGLGDYLKHMGYSVEIKHINSIHCDTIIVISWREPNAKGATSSLDRILKK